MFSVVSALFLLPLVAAQYGYGDSGSSATTSSSAAASFPSAPPSTSTQINVDVASQGQFVFNPNNFTAAKGSLVTFYFPSNGIQHSVTQSSFANPCTYLAATSSTPAGFDSGLTAGTKFTINITDDTQPIYIHCKQLLHCGMGMVAAINAAPANFSSFLQAAQKIGSSEVSEVTATAAVTGGVGAVATAVPVDSKTSTSGSGNGASQLAISGVPVLLFALLLTYV